MGVLLSLLWVCYVFFHGCATFSSPTDYLFFFFCLCLCSVFISCFQASAEFCVLIIATLCGCYSFVGGLGSTFYVCYFNAVMVFALLAVLVVNIFYLEHDQHPLLGDVDVIYQRLACLQGPETNEAGSFLTFWSEGAIIWACAGVCITASITFCDQVSVGSVLPDQCGKCVTRSVWEVWTRSIWAVCDQVSVENV